MSRNEKKEKKNGATWKEHRMKKKVASKSFDDQSSIRSFLLSSHIYIRCQRTNISSSRFFVRLFVDFTFLCLQNDERVSLLFFRIQSLYIPAHIELQIHGMVLIGGKNCRWNFRLFFLLSFSLAKRHFHLIPSRDNFLLDLDEILRRRKQTNEGIFSSWSMVLSVIRYSRWDDPNGFIFIF